METEKVKCIKCHEEYGEQDCIKTNKGYICNKCLNKAKRKRMFAAIAAGLIVIAIGGFIYFLHFQKNTTQGFSGVNNIQDSTKVSVDKKGNTSFRMNVAVAQSAPVDAGQTIDNIESFKKAYEKNVQVARAKKAKGVIIPSIKVLFSFDKSNLNGDANNLLKEYAGAYLKTNRKAIITIDGYACNLGPNGINKWISKQRAENVRATLISAGVPKGKIEVHWYGKSRNAYFSYSSYKDYRRANINIK